MFKIFSKIKWFKWHPGPTKVILGYFYLSQSLQSPVFEGRIILNSSYCSIVNSLLTFCYWTKYHLFIPFLLPCMTLQCLNAPISNTPVHF